MTFILLVILLNGDYYGGEFSSRGQCQLELRKLEADRVLASCEPRKKAEQGTSPVV